MWIERDVWLSEKWKENMTSGQVIAAELRLGMSEW